VDRPRRIFIIGNFKDESAQSIRIERRRWPKGFIRLGHDVQRFSYRNIMQQESFIKSKRFAVRFAKKSADKVLSEQLRAYCPDIVLVLNPKDLDCESVRAMRKAASDAVFVARDNEPFPHTHPERLALCAQMDIVLCSSPEEFLEPYRQAGAKRCFFLPNPCDPDIQRPYDVEDKWKSDIMFAGKLGHENLSGDPDRYELLRRLSKTSGAKLYGCFGHPKIDGIEVFYAISGAKIALSINIVNNVRLYHSDRLINCISCGTFTLAKKVPGSELLFEDNVHLRYFDTADEFFELADWYLRHDKEREKIARAGMERAHQEFNCTKMARRMLEILQNENCHDPYAQKI